MVENVSALNGIIGCREDLERCRICLDIREHDDIVSCTADYMLYAILCCHIIRKRFAIRIMNTNRRYIFRAATYQRRQAKGHCLEARVGRGTGSRQSSHYAPYTFDLLMNHFQEKKANKVRQSFSPLFRNTHNRVKYCQIEL